MDKLTNTKDKAVGKVLETAGKLTNDQELEFTGKFQTMTSEVKDKLTDVKEDVYQEANDLMDRVNDNRVKGNNKNR
jgi:uncharacterized protein YjbJ (UPF0337 family)